MYELGLRKSYRQRSTYGPVSTSRPVFIWHLISYLNMSVCVCVCVCVCVFSTHGWKRRTAVSVSCEK